MLLLMHRLVLSLTCVAALGAIACGASRQPPGLEYGPTYTHSYATYGCGETDAIVLVLYFLNSSEKSYRPSGPHLRVQVRPPSEPSDQTIRLTASAAQCTSGASCVSTAGQITFSKVRPGKSYEGEIDLTVAGGERVRQAFKAPADRWRSWSSTRSRSQRST